MLALFKAENQQLSVEVEQSKQLAVLLCSPEDKLNYNLKPQSEVYLIKCFIFLYKHVDYKLEKYS